LPCVQTLESHTTPITALDFSEPYGTLVSASEEDAQPRVWDLLTGTEVGRLRGHIGAVKCLQVEDSVCLTGSEDGNVRLWDLRKVEDDEEWGTARDRVPAIPEEDENDDGELVEKPNGIRYGGNTPELKEKDGPCMRLLEGHSRAVTALYFEDECLVRYLPSFYLFTSLTSLEGHRCRRQDTATVGSDNRPVCNDHGHSLGNLSSGIIFRRLW
jgi:division protein 1